MKSALSLSVRMAPVAACVLALVAGTQAEKAPPAPSGSETRVHGIDRLAWDQGASSYESLRQYTFTVYIDGVAATLSGVECLNSGGKTFACSAPLPEMSSGLHALQLTTVADGMESGKSEAVFMNVPPAATVAAAHAREGAGVASRPGGEAFCTGSTTVCFSVQRRITRSVPLSAPALLPDGRLLFVENGRDIRMTVGGLLVGESSLRLPDRGSRVVALLIDPSFERTRLVRMAWVHETPRGRTIAVTRLRESNNRLGEPAVVVPAIPLPPSGEPRVAQDDHGRIYIAIPAGDRQRRALNGYGGQILRVSADGLSWAAGLGQPLFTSGYDDPFALTFDPAKQRLWVGGADRNGKPSLRVIAIGHSSPVAPGLRADLRPPAYEIATTSAPGGGLVLLAASGRSSDDELLIVDGEGALVWTRPRVSGSLFERVEVPGEHVMAVDAGALGAIFLTTSSTDGSGAFSLLRIQKRDAR